MRQKAYDKKVKEIANLKALNVTDQNEMENIAQEQGRINQTARNLLAQSNELFAKTEIRSKRIEKLELQTENYKPKN